MVAVAGAVLVAGGALAAALWPHAPIPRPSRPRSAYADIDRIDVHVHVPASRAAEARQVFARNGVTLALNANGGEVSEGLLPYCHVAWDRVEQPGFAEQAIEGLRACRARGGIGLKIFKALGLGIRTSDGELLRVDDPRLDPVFEAAGELSLPVLIHTGDPQAFFRPDDDENERHAELSAHPSWSFHGPGWPSWEDVFAEYETRVARHPGTTFVGAHFGNAPEEPERVGAMLARYDNLYVETGARVPEIGRHDARRMHDLFVRWRRRILFGTDVQMGRSGTWVLGSAGEDPDPPARIPVFYEAHWRYFETADRRFAHPTPIQGNWTIDGIDLPREVLEDLYRENAIRVFGLAD
ncbi:MAG: amidohydrolase family protein [Myxococcales bacterium]|nr:amidohydrolase family protein [Myxococcales bacterium]